MDDTREATSASAAETPGAWIRHVMDRAAENGIDPHRVLLALGLGPGALDDERREGTRS